MTGAKGRMEQAEDDYGDGEMAAPYSGTRLLKLPCAVPDDATVGSSPIYEYCR